MHEASSNENLDENSKTEQIVPAPSGRIQILDMLVKHLRQDIKAILVDRSRPHPYAAA